MDFYFILYLIVGILFAVCLRIQGRPERWALWEYFVEILLWPVTFVAFFYSLLKTIFNVKI